MPKNKPPELANVVERLLTGAERLVSGAERVMGDAEKIAAERAQQAPVENPFRDALRARTKRVFVTPALIALHAAVYFGMAFGDGAAGDPETLMSWGASFGPRTTNGEWWRLVTSIFIGTGFFQLLVNTAGLLQAGLIVERLVGPAALVTTYLAAGVFASLVGVSEQPLAVTGGPSAAIFGVCGLLVATFLLGLIRRTTASIPISALRNLAPAAGIFMLYSLVASGQQNLAGLTVGFACGSILALGVTERKAPPRRVAAIAAAAAIAGVATALPLSGIADVRPEIARIAALEDQTTTEYDKAIGRFKTGRLSPDALAKFIDKEILPDLSTAQERLRAIRGVPRQHQPLVAGADQYLRLRKESFRLRIEAVRKTNLKKLQQAEVTETAAREALEKIRPVQKG
jgi:membrane associated rhomboid family serine protease